MKTQNTFIEGCFMVSVPQSGYSFAVSAYGRDEKTIIELCWKEGYFESEDDAKNAILRPMTEDDFAEYRDNIAIFEPNYI